MVNDDAPGNDGRVAGEERASALQVRVLGLALVSLAIALAYLLACIWPASFAPDTAGSKQVAIVFIGTSAQLATTADVQLLMLVMVAGALGSFLHTATSFADFVGNEKLARSWLWWYLLKPFIGMGLAVIFYLVIRGGLLSAGTEAGKVNIYGIAALAGLTGMFSKQATDKLGEVFTTLFQTRPGEGDDARKGSLANPVPVLADVVPTHMATRTQALDVQIKGTGFARSAVVRVNGSARETVYDNSSSLSAKLVAGDVAQDGVLSVVVFNPPPGGGSSTPLRMTVASALDVSAPVVAAAPQAPSPGQPPV
ncbi:MAG: hypothetical protein ACJ8GJ_14670 [Vitreoscilla sp.]